MRTRAGIILQARLGSTRLPGKALEPVGGQPMLERCLRRLVAGGVAHVVLATTRSAEDDALEAIAERVGVPTFRGDTNDVLGRFTEAAAAFDLDPIVRATGDNPGVDIQAPGRLLAALRDHDLEYVREEGLPFGGGVEAFTAEALERAAARARSPYDREHVTTFMRRNPKLFRIREIAAPAPLWRPLLRLSVDTRQDLAWVRELFFRAGADEPSMAQLIASAGRGGQQKAA
jgi:spore coat polysaccharide biosynthesis protein SpsF (cytidylyltransferase family)